MLGFSLGIMLDLVGIHHEDFSSHDFGIFPIDRKHDLDPNVAQRRVNPLLDLS